MIHNRDIKDTIKNGPYYKPAINDLANAIEEWREKKQFVTSKDNIPEKLMLIVTELAEAMEAFRKDPSLADKEIRFNFEEELADTIIRILDLCSALDIDIAQSLALKMTFNESRPPKHDKKL